MKVTLCALLVFSGILFAQQPSPGVPSPLEFRGLRTGMHQPEINAVLKVETVCMNLDAKMGIAHSGWLCVDPHGSPDLSIALGPSGAAWEIDYHFENSPLESVASFAEVFARKYGKPHLTTKTYRNGIGNEVTGVEYSWQRKTQVLTVREICDDPEISCVQLDDKAYAPKARVPAI